MKRDRIRSQDASGKRAGLFIVLAIFAASGLLVSIPSALAATSLQVSPTPIPISLPTLTPLPAQEATVTPTRTPTPVGPALVEALQPGTNVRSGPDINAERLGGIDPGNFYPVIGYGEGTRWIKIQYPDSPNGTAWVYEEVVQVTGDLENIPYIDVSTEPTIDANPIIATQTIEAMRQTPGALQTATALAAAAGIGGPTLPPVGTPTILPTFTYPPDVMLQATPLVEAPAPSVLEGGGFPPIIPIIALAAVGGLGLLLGLLRRIR